MLFYYAVWAAHVCSCWDTNTAVVSALLVLAPCLYHAAGDRPLQLVAARDVGLAAATALTSSSPRDWAGQRLPLAGDELTPLQMCEAFSKAQGGMPVKHSCPPAWLFWFLSRWGGHSALAAV
jgi:hypothetical protein